MSDPADNLPPKQQKAIAALMTANTIADAAVVVGVNERQIYRWLTEPAFAEAYRTARREAVNQAIARSQQHSSDAVQVLVDIMKDTSKSAMARISAASKVIEFSVKAVELEDLAERLAALEAAYATKL